MATRIPILRIPRSLFFRDDDKPYIEAIHGRLERKMSPKRMHGRLQGRLWAWLDAWAGVRGETATEWRFYFVRGEGKPSSLVPDVAYVSYDRLPRDLPDDARERPRLAPDIAVEIWSPGDREAVLAEKLELYFAHGSRVVIIVYPQERTIAFHHAGEVVTLETKGVLRVPGYDDLLLDADKLFENL